MSELDVIVIPISAPGRPQSTSGLFAERELPRWREYKARGGLPERPDLPGGVRHGRPERRGQVTVIAVEVPGHAAHSEQ